MTAPESGPSVPRRRGPRPGPRPVISPEAVALARQHNAEWDSSHYFTKGGSSGVVIPCTGEGCPHCMTAQEAEVAVCPRQKDRPVSPVADFDIERVRKAILDQGSHPIYHREVMERHRKEWPTLWKALDTLLKAGESRG